MKKLAIFASGAGSNALNLIEKSLSFENLEISCLVVDTETSPLPDIIAKINPALPVYRILPDPSLKGSERKLQFEKKILQKLKYHDVGWILLAGYMRLIGPTLLDHFPNRMINIHPSLLPHYPGLNSFERAYIDGVSSGVTIHLVDSGLDTGPVIVQRSFPRLKDDTLSDFIQRGKSIEWELYPEILKRLNDSADLLPGV